MIRVVVADDHPLVREGVRRVLDLAGDIAVVGEAQGGAEALRLCQQLCPDVLLTDLSMPDQNGVDVTRAVRAAVPQTRVIVLTIHADVQYLAAALQAGATSYCLKDVAPQVLIEAIRAACRGESYVPPELEERSRQVVPLTPREREVLAMVAAGLSNKEIGERLFISEKTARNHISHIFEKIGVQDRTQAALYAIERGLVPRQQ